MTDFLNAFLPPSFSAEELVSIGSLFREKRLRIGEFFVREGTVSQHLGFVVEGTLQFFLNHDGQELTTYIAQPGGVAVSVLSFLRQTPAREAIRAVTGCRLAVLRRSDLHTLNQTSPAFKDFYLGILEYQIACIDESRFDLLTLTAEERYLKLLEHEPERLQQIPLQYLASMLGVTPRHLSRIRRTIR